MCVFFCCRFIPFPQIETDCILALDDDIEMISPSELEFGFQVTVLLLLPCSMLQSIHLVSHSCWQRLCASIPMRRNAADDLAHTFPVHLHFFPALMLRRCGRSSLIGWLAILVAGIRGVPRHAAFITPQCGLLTSRWS